MIALSRYFAIIAPMESTLLSLNGGIPTWLILAYLWSIPWKGVALWKSARLSQKKWFLVILISNTFGVLDIVYIYFIASKYTVETVEEK